MPLTINQAFSQFIKRAERSTTERLVSTFVGIDNLVAALMSQDHRIIFGRRGTGKTHALNYVAEVNRERGHCAVFVDMRTIGSDQSIYTDQTKDLSERATRLLIDTLTKVHDSLLEIAIDHSEEFDLSQASRHFDRLSLAISTVRVIGDVSLKVDKSLEHQTSHEAAAAVSADLRSGISAKLQGKSEQALSQRAEQSFSTSGRPVYSVIFGDVFAGLNGIVESFGKKHIWILMDEWSSIPYDLQPYLADLIRRCIFPINSITVQIAAIEQRCNFLIHGDGGSYVGIELGADAAADVNLDDFMVFDNDAERAKNFFRQFLFNHYSAVEGRDPAILINDGRELIRYAFTEVRAFEEFVRAVEGVPRDAMNIVSLAALKAGDQRISVQMIRSAARDWYQRDKASILNYKSQLNDLLQWIISEVIENRKARAFLLRSDQRDEMIDELFDARLLHLLKKSVAAHDKPGVRYLVYKLDYGCYVDLLITAKAPEGLLPGDSHDEGAAFVDVPPDDYRAIRRAILDISQFRAAHPKNKN